MLDKLCQHNASDIQSVLTEGVNQAENIHIVGDAEVAADLLFDDVICIDCDNNLRVILQLTKHPDLTVRLKARKHARCMEIVEKLAAEFQIELAAELRNPLFDSGGLHFQILVVVKADTIHRFIILRFIPLRENAMSFTAVLPSRRRSDCACAYLHVRCNA